VTHPIMAIYLADALTRSNGPQRAVRHAAADASPHRSRGQRRRAIARVYRSVLGPFGPHEENRFPSYRGTEEVVYLRFGDAYLGLRPADGGEHRYYDVGIEHFAFYVDSRAEVDDAYQRCLDIGARVHFPPEEDRDIEGFYELFVFDPDGLRVEVACGPPGWHPSSGAGSTIESR
jgi:catechol 2,3-dioxygenase-like lactoylglutathione lyase family enzyme